LSKNTSTIVSKVWSFADVLRDDGIGYGDYLEQLTYLIFLKMADELSKPPYDYDVSIPEEYNWESLVAKDGAELETHYTKLLLELGQGNGFLGQIFTKAQNRIQDPAKLYRIIKMIDNENWNLMGADIKGQIYEGLLAKYAEDIKSGAGQYFTPRPLIRAMVECVAPKPEKTIHDPACGTGGFFLAAYDFIKDNYKLNKDQKKFLKYETFSGNEIVASTRRMCLMNMFLHNIGNLNAEPPISSTDSLVSDPGDRYDYVLTNPPFGKKSSVTYTNEKGEQQKDKLVYNRQDFWTTSSNKQLNFLQHIHTILKIGGTAAVVLPDNVLFEGGAGETVRKNILKKTNLHTILRLPTGIFYKPGVKANVIFFESKPASKQPWTKEIWFYDMRTNQHFTLKRNPMTFDDLQHFIECYNPENIHAREQTYSTDNPDGRWRKYTYGEIVSRDKTNLDIFWIKDDDLTDLDSLPDPEILASDIVENLESGLESFKEIEYVLGE